MAVRDTRRYRGRSLVVLLMVGLPTALLCAALVLAATADVSDAESIGPTMGPAAAVIDAPTGNRVVQGPDGMVMGMGGEGDARDIPGYDPDADAASNASAIAELLGRPVAASTETSTAAIVDDRQITLEAVTLERPQAYPGKLTLLSGHWPRGADEVLISPGAADRGIPESGPLHVGQGDQARTVEVVGTVRALGRYSLIYDLVATSSLPGDENASPSWYVSGEAAVSWEEVGRLNEYGLPVTSAAVLRDPPPASAMDPAVATAGSIADAQSLLIATLAGSFMLMMAVLLVCPAFTVSAGRQRRTLALAAANGATSAQLRRAVLGQAVVLAAVSVTVGVILGVAGALGGLYYFHEVRHGWLGPIDVPTLPILAVGALAAACTVLAALLPAIQVARMDLISALGGRQSATAPSRWLFLFGLLAAGTGAAGVLWSARATTPEFTIVLCMAALVVGALLTVPALLHQIGKAGGPLPLPLRLATRDLARHRSRSAPTVAAVLAGTAALTTLLVAMTSDDAQGAREYVPSSRMGEASISLFQDSSTPQETQDSSALQERWVTREPALRFIPLLTTDWSPTLDSEGFASVVPRGCTVAETLEMSPGDEAAFAAAEAEPATPRCMQMGSHALGGGGVAALPAEEIVRRFELTGDDAAEVRAGGALLIERPVDRDLTTDGRISLAFGSLTYPDEDTLEVEATPMDEVTLPVTQIGYDDAPPGADAAIATVFLPSESVEPEWPFITETFLVHSTTGPVTHVQAERLAADVGERGNVYLEEGYQSESTRIRVVLLAVFTVLLLVVTLTSTGLGLAEQQGDQATLEAVGAGRWTRRLIAGAGALSLSLLGAALGVLLGLVPGIALARALTAQPSYDPLNVAALDGPIIVIPWATLAVMSFLCPLVAGTVAAVAIRRNPDTTRRGR